MSVPEHRIEEVTQHVILLFGGAESLCREVVSEAARYFANCPDDFCLQWGHDAALIFGGVNRLVWRPDQGFRPDPGSCTQRFLDHADAIQVRSQ